MNRPSLIAVLLLAAALAALLVRSPPRERAASSQLEWIATARQFGPVGYRDPVGAISRDGKWIAFSEGRFLRVRAVGGGASVEFPDGSGQIRHLAWNPDNRTIIADGDEAGTWAVYDRVDGSRKPLQIAGAETSDTKAMRQLAVSPDGAAIAGIVGGPNGPELRIVAPGPARAPNDPRDRPAPRDPSFPAWSPRGEVACIAMVDGRRRVTLPCGQTAVPGQPDRDAYGPIAFAPDGEAVFVSYGNDTGTVDLWTVSTARGTAARLTTFSRDAYAPSIAADGSVLFKVQNYRTSVAAVSASGGPIRSLAAFQSETPSWDPTGKWIGITYGTWRRVPDDARYPDIAQDAGIISADAAEPASAPSTIIHDSASEDQSLCWSPNGKWIAFHSHKDQSDDLWLRRADGDPAARRITMLGRGAETGWPRWSRDGRRVLFTGASPRTHQSAIYIVGVDQESGVVTAPAREVALGGPPVDVLHAEWQGDGAGVVAIVKDAPGRHAIVTLSADGGLPAVVRRFASEHDNPGLGVSPDGQQVAFIAPAADGFFQVFRMPIRGGAPVQVTTNPSNKTQPSWSPDGGRIAFTVWDYGVAFYLIRGRDLGFGIRDSWSR
jgi:Tol biopolymer transport system component